MRGVLRGIGLAKRRNAEGAEDFGGLPGQRGEVLCKAPVRLGQPDVEPGRIGRKARRREGCGEKGPGVVQKQGAQGQRPFPGEERPGTLAEQFHIRPHAGQKLAGNRPLGELHGDGGVPAGGRNVSDDEKHGNMAHAGFIEDLRTEGAEGGFLRGNETRHA